MKPTVTLGRLAGVEVGINWSWLIVLALVAWSLAASVFPESNPGLAPETYVVMAVVAVPVFFACLLLHELGHATRARREGMEIDGITLWVFGGVARFRGTFPSAGAEFRIAIAGPLVSLVLGVAFAAAGRLAPLPSAVDGVVTWLGSVNLLLLAFNLVPALPLDGGRVLRAALWQVKGDYAAATRAAAGLGRLFGQILIAGGTLMALLLGSFGGVWLALIGWFLLAAAQAEAQAAVAHVALAGLHVRDVMVTAPVTVDAGLPLEHFRDVFLAHRYTAYPVLEAGAPVGIVGYRDARTTVRRQPGAVVRGQMTPLGVAGIVAPDDPLEAAWTTLLGAPLQRLLVLDGGRLAGLLSPTDVVRILDAGAPRRRADRVAA